MDMTQTDPPGTAAINSYIGRVDAAARGLSPDRRIELLDQLREHLDAVSRSPEATESSVLVAIDRLGDPTEIVASDVDLPAQSAATAIGAASSRRGWGPLEIMAVVLLIGGGFVIPIIGPLAGLVCAWFSPAWTRGEKWIATALSSGSILLVAALLVGSIF